MKKYILYFKPKGTKEWRIYNEYKESREPITTGRRIVKNEEWIFKVKVTEIEENTIYEEEGL